MMKMKSVAVLAAAALALSGGTAMAQQTTGSSSGRTQGTSGPQNRGGTTSQHETVAPGADTKGRSSEAFVREAAVGGMAEVELGHLATEHAGSDEVKQFARRIVADHTKANDELKTLARNKSITLPTELDATHKQTKEKLSKLNGAAFDRAYMDEMRKDHRKDVNEFRQQSRSGSDPDVKAFAAKTLPTLEEHLQLAERTHAAVGTTGSKTDKTSKPGPTGTSGPGAAAPSPGTPDAPRGGSGSVPGTGIGR